MEHSIFSQCIPLRSAFHECTIGRSCWHGPHPKSRNFAMGNQFHVRYKPFFAINATKKLKLLIFFNNRYIWIQSWHGRRETGSIFEHTWRSTKRNATQVISLMNISGTNPTHTTQIIQQTQQSHSFKFSFRRSVYAKLNSYNF